MPYINIQVTDEGVTRAQKQALIAGVAKLMAEVLQKPAHLTFTVIEEVATDNWGIGYDQVSELRQTALAEQI